MEKVTKHYSKIPGKQDVQQCGDMTRCLCTRKGLTSIDLTGAANGTADGRPGAKVGTGEPEAD